MPIVSMFYGIIVSIFYEGESKHKRPHIHARYQGKSVSVSIENGEILAGDIPSKQKRLIQAWIDIHKEELLADWELASSGEKPFRIKPLQ